MPDFLSEPGDPPRRRVPTLRWTEHEHYTMLEAKRVLTLEEHGMLQVLHDLYCHRSGALPDDPKFIAGQAGITPVRWKRIKSVLLDKGFLVIDGENLMCSLKREAVSDGIKRMDDGRKGGKASAAARRSRGRPAGFSVPELGNSEFSAS